MAAGTRDLTDKSTSAASTGAVFKLTKELDFNDIVTVKGGAIEANEIAQLISVPAGTLVLSVVMEMVVAGAGTTLTAQVGDGGNALGFIGTSDMTAEAGTMYGPANTLDDSATPVADPAFFAGKLYTAADTIDVKVIGYNTVSALPTVRVTAVCTDVN